MSTLNDAADGLVAVINAIDGGIHFFPSATKDHPKLPTVTGEIAFRQLEMESAMPDGAWKCEAVLTLTTRANAEGWMDALRRMRDYASPHGEKSIFRAIIANKTLGGRVRTCLPKRGGLLDERRVRFPDGDRWTQDMLYEIRIGPEEDTSEFA